MADRGPGPDLPAVASLILVPGMLPVFIYRVRVVSSMRLLASGEARELRGTQAQSRVLMSPLWLERASVVSLGLPGCGQIPLLGPMGCES